MSSETGADSIVLCDVSEGIAQITLDRPERMNAFTPKLGAGYDDPCLASTREARGLARLGRLPAAAEGVRAFLQKRPAAWKLTARDAPPVD